MIILLLIIISCGKNKAEKVNNKIVEIVEIEQLKLEEEINIIDSLSEELETAKTSIEESIKKLDALFNEL